MTTTSAAEQTFQSIAEACFEHDLRIHEMLPVALMHASDRDLDDDDVERLAEMKEALTDMVCATKALERTEVALRIGVLVAADGDDRGIAREELRDLCTRHGAGWVGRAETPVRSDGLVSWGWTVTRWFWAPTYTGLIDAMFAWDALQ